MRLPLLLSVPHAGRRVPEEVVDACRLTADEIREDGDEGAEEIYRLSSEVAGFVTTDVARAIVDLNRAETDRRPDGVVKTHTCMNVPVYDPFPPEGLIVRLLERYYRPYHARLRDAAGSEFVLGIDCHTMLAIGPPIGPLAGEARPRICLSDGVGSTCPPDRFAVVVDCFGDAFEIEPAVNEPFSGGFICRSHAAEMPWVQLELSREPFLSDGEKRERVLAALRQISERIG